MTVATAAVIAFAYANPFNGLTSLLSIAFLMGFVVVNRPKRPPATERQSSWLSWVVLCATVFVVFFVATAPRNAQTPGTAVAFGVQFLSAVILLGVGSAICAYLEARRRRKHPSAGAADEHPAAPAAPAAASVASLDHRCGNDHVPGSDGDTQIANS